MRVAILGGTGAMGRFLARELSEDGHEITITGSSYERARRVARELGVEAAPDNVAAVRDADVVIVSVPISVTERVIEEVGPHVPDGALLTDVTSVKVRPVRAMLEHTSEGVYVLGTHPLFGPTVPSLKSQTVILTPTERSGPWTRRVRRYLERKGANVIVCTPEEHDRAMALVQCLTHFVLLGAGIAIGDLLPELELDPTELASPVYRLFIDVIGRVLGQNPRLYAEIQAFNPYAEWARERVLRALERIHELADDHAQLTEFLREGRERLSRHLDLEGCQSRTDKLLSYLLDELEVAEKCGEAIVIDVRSRRAREGRIRVTRGTVSVDGEELPRDRVKILPRRPKRLARFEGTELELRVKTELDPEEVACVVESLGRNLRVLRADDAGDEVRLKLEGSEEAADELVKKLRSLGVRAELHR